MTMSSNVDDVVSASVSTTKVLLQVRRKRMYKNVWEKDPTFSLLPSCMKKPFFSFLL